MQTTDNIDRKLAELQRQQAEAQRLENERIERERQHALKIQQTKSEIATLQNQRRLQAFQERKQQNETIIEQHNAQLAEMLAAFDAVLPALMPLFDLLEQANASHDKQQEFKTHTVGEFMQGFDDRFKAPYGLEDNPGRVQQERTQQYSTEVMQAFNQLKNAVGGGRKLAEWQSRATEPREIRARAALLWMAIQAMDNPRFFPPDYDAQDSQDTDIRNRLATRRWG